MSQSKPTKVTKEASNDMVMGSVPRFSFRPGKLVKPLAVLVAVALVAAGFWLYAHNRQQNRAVSNNACSSKAAGDLLRQAFDAVDSSKVAELTAIAQKVQKLPDYQHDPKCLFVLVNYYINTGDYPNAKSYLDRLNKAYAADPTLANYSLGGKKIKDLRQDVDFMAQQAEQAHKNVRTFSAP
ncbi:MAG TPA: hypothetical protein VLG37_03515 [Candidatus Saccharimonadales bacterium]|nr:hypothetical protein [Candidatus Saccharimonadales bacterium]